MPQDSFPEHVTVASQCDTDLESRVATLASKLSVNIFEGSLEADNSRGMCFMSVISFLFTAFKPRTRMKERDGERKKEDNKHLCVFIVE